MNSKMKTSCRENQNTMTMKLEDDSIKEKILMKNEDLDSERDLNESEDEDAVNEF